MTPRSNAAIAIFAVALAACAGPQPTAPTATRDAGTDRAVLPIAEPETPTITEPDARKATPPPRFEVKAPQGAPNVVIVLIDDAGFGHAGAFGGPINTPTLETLASNGLRYNRFHTTALCSPTRTALLTGRNHHSVGMGGITEISTGAPGYSSVLPNTKAPLAVTLKLNG